MTYPARIARLSALFAVLVLAAGGAVAASVTEELAVGAVLVANAKLFANADDPAGLDLLRFALALDPENRDALLMQAKVDRKQKLDDVQLADGGKQYTDYVLNVAKQTRSRKRRLLLYRVVELVSPKNETALLELTKAKNKGTDTSFSALLQVMLPDAPKTEGDDDDEEDGKETGKPATNEDVFTVLDGISYQRGYSYVLSDPTFALNNLNSALIGRGLTVRYESKKNPLRESRGMSRLYYSPAEAAWPAPSCPELVYYFSSELREGNRTYADWVRLVCAWHNLGWRTAPKGIAIVDPDDKEVGKGSGVPVLADVLVTTNKEGRLDFREKYYEKRLFVYGYVSGVSKDFVHLVHDQVRLDFASGTDAARIQALSADYTESKRDATGNRVVFFAGTGVCTGVRTGRVMLSDCGAFSWYAGRQRN